MRKQTTAREIWKRLNFRLTVRAGAVTIIGARAIIIVAMATVRIAITGMRPMPIGRVIIDRITGPIDPSIRLTAITDRAIIDRITGPIDLSIRLTVITGRVPSSASDLAVIEAGSEAKYSLKSKRPA